MAQPRSPREVFLALVNGIAEGNPDGLPELYAEQTNVVHPFDPLRGAPLRSRDELRKRMESLAARPGRAAGWVTSRSTRPPIPRSSWPSSLRRPQRAGGRPGPDRRGHLTASARAMGCCSADGRAARRCPGAAGQVSWRVSFLFRR
ncbi:MAG: hypothetical protein ABSA53_25965 [Streptosporangiaceae bacterium]|jgi:hypothetical protein